MRVVAPADLVLSRLQVEVKRGESIEVPDEIGSQLIAQGWTEPKAPKADTPKAPKAKSKES